MSEEREVRKKTDFWGNEKEIIYQDGKQVGEIRTEERGGFLDFFTETTRVEYDKNRNEVSHTTREERRGFCGIGSKEIDVKRDSNGNELSTLQVEKRGGILGIDSHFVKAERDVKGKIVSESHHEIRGDFLGLGGERVRVIEYTSDEKQKTSSSHQKPGMDHNGTYSTTSRNTTSAGFFSGFLLFSMIILIVLVIANLYFAKASIFSHEQNKYHWSNIAEMARTQNIELLHTLQKGFTYSYIKIKSFARTFGGLYSEINFKFKQLSERLDVLKEYYEFGQINSLEFLKQLLEITKETMKVEWDPYFNRESLISSHEKNALSPAAKHNYEIVGSWWDGGPNCADIAPQAADRVVFKVWYCEVGIENAPSVVLYQHNQQYQSSDGNVVLSLIQKDTIKVELKSPLKDKLGNTIGSGSIWDPYFNREP